jgi:hypothetical protein
MSIEKFNVMDTDVPCISEVMGGYKSRIAIIRKCDITDYPKKQEINVSSMSLEDVCNFTGNLVYS